MNSPFGILLVSTALFWCLAQPGSAANAAFFRIAATNETRIVDFDPTTGSMAWICSGGTATCRVDMAAPSMGSWTTLLADDGDGASEVREVSLLDATADVAFATLVPGDAFFLQTNAVVRSPQEWAMLWDAGGRPTPATDIDFSREMVGVVAMGAQISTGYEIWVQHVALHWDRMVVRYGESYPGPGDPVFWVVTFPCHFVRMPRQDVPCTWLLDGD